MYGLVVIPHLMCTVEHLRADDCLGKHWIHGEFGHTTAKSGQLSLVVQCSKTIQQLKCADHGLRRRLVEEVKVDQIVDTERLEHEHDHTEVSALNFWYSILWELIAEGPFGVQTEGLAGADTTRTSSTLLRRCTRYLKELGKNAKHWRFN
jgi:hypothetical protein